MKVSRPFIQSQYLSSVLTSARGSACAMKVAFGWQYALQPSQPLPVSHASKNLIATSLIDIFFSSLKARVRTCRDRSPHILSHRHHAVRWLARHPENETSAGISSLFTADGQRERKRR